MPSTAVIEEFLSQDRIAFVGASRDPKQFANSVYRHLRDGGRTMLPVHPDVATVEGDAAYGSLAEVPGPLGGVVVMLPSAATVDVVRQCVELGVPRVWLHRGMGGKEPPAEAVQACREAGVAVVDGACPLMFAAPVGGFHRFHRSILRRRITA